MLTVDVGPSSSAQPSSSTHHSASTNSFSNRDGHTYLEISYDELEFPEYHKVKRLGRGSYGTVLQATWQGKRVAAKMVETDIDHKTIHNEAKLLHELVHANIIKLYAVFKGEQMGLILELMEGGSLHELLHQSRHIKYYTEHVFWWALQCASAVQYLHGKDLVHRDLKPSNMLLTNDYITLKLCDFGTAAELKTSMTNNRGTAAWMAPEVFRGRKYDQKCDIFSFGILLWEMISRRQPFTDSDSHAYTILWQVSEGRRPPLIDNCPRPIMDLITRCWDNEPNQRPNIDEVVQIIEFMREVFWNYEKPLIDLTTQERAFAHLKGPCPTRSTSTTMDSGYETKHHTPSAPSENWNEDSPTIKAPIPPPRPPPPPAHRRSHSGSDFTQTQVPYAPPTPHVLPPGGHPPYLPAQFNPHINGMNGSRSMSSMTVVTTSTQPPVGFNIPTGPTPPGSLNGPSMTNPPHGRSPIPPSFYQPSYGPNSSYVPATPTPNAQPYSPCTTNNLQPAPPSYYHSSSTPGSSGINSHHLGSGDIGWRRSSEPPYDAASLGSATSGHEKKKKSSLGKLFKGVKKELQALGNNKI